MKMPAWLWALTGAAILAVAVYIGVLFGAPLPFMPAPHETGVACTTDAMQCPDGSWVGRTGPNCQFVCPAAATSTGTASGSAVVTVHIGQTVAAVPGITITPIKVIEDSRCPVDVECIQAGTVRLEAQVVTEMGTSTQTFTTGAPITLGSATIVLADVAPVRHSKSTLAPSDYVFVFQIDSK